MKPVQPIGPMPARTVIVPVALACVPFLAMQAVGWQVVQTPVAIAASTGFSAVALAVVLAAFSRREDLAGWGLAVTFGWVIVDAVNPTSSTAAPVLIAVGALWAVAFRSAGGPGIPPLSNGRAVAFAAAATAVFVSVVFVARVGLMYADYPLDVGGGLAAGAGSCLVATMLCRPSFGARVATSVGSLVAVLGVLSCMVPVFAATDPPILLWGTRPLVIGAALCGLALGVVAGPLWCAIACAVVIPAICGLLVERDGLPIAVLLAVMVTGLLVIARGRRVVSATATGGVGRLLVDVPASERVVGLATEGWSTVTGRLQNVDRAATRLMRQVFDRVVDRHSSSDGSTPRSSELPTDSSPRGNALEWLVPVGLWVTIATAVTTIASNLSLAEGAWPERWVLPSPLDVVSTPTGRIGWGTGDYWAIADHGYVLSEHREAFLPFLPLVLRFLREITGWGLPQCQVVVANASGLACALLFWTWMRRRLMSFGERLLALLVFLVFPWNFLLFGYGYADATVVALTIGAMLLIERGRPLLAGLVGAAAVTTRPNGIPVVIFAVLHELVRSETVTVIAVREGWGLPWSRSRWLAIRPRRLGAVRWPAILLPLGALVALSVFMGLHAGEPLLWMTQETWYGHEPVTTLAAWLETIFLPWPSEAIANGWEVANQVATAFVTLGALFAIPRVHRRYGAVYASYAIVIWLIAWSGSRVFTPGARLLMPITPFLAALAAPVLLRRRGLAAAVVATSIAGSLGLVALFTRGGNLWVGW